MTTHTRKVIPFAPYLARPARWRLETPTERRERRRQNERILANAGFPRVYRLHRRWDAVGASYGEPDGGRAS